MEFSRLLSVGLLICFLSISAHAQNPGSVFDPQATPSATAVAGVKGGRSYRHPVSARNRYHRVICVVPLVGAGTLQDPKRPKYLPTPSSKAPSLTGILAFQQIPTDDRNFAVVEFVAADISALSPILNDKSLKVFQRGIHSRALIEQEIKLVRKDFDMTQFGVAIR